MRKKLKNIEFFYNLLLNKQLVTVGLPQAELVFHVALFLQL